jgi:hypothetical protein
VNDPWLGRRVDRFDVVSPLGRGAHGVVYRARDVVSGRDVALKLLLDARLDARHRARFRREGELTAALHHPGIVRIHGAGELEGGVPYLTYELVEGARTLAAASAQADLPRRVAWVRDAARALGAAHAQGVVHRDVKPDNLLIDAREQLRVTDFGVAWAASASRLTRTGTLVGTPHFMAPEQLAPDGREPRPTCDVWGLGVILYQALTGALPFEGRSFEELTIQVVSVDPRPPRQLAPAVPPSLEAVCLRCLEKEPDARYPDGEALALDLDRALAGAAIRAPSRRLSPGARRALLLAIGPAVALGALAAALLMPAPTPVRGGDPGPPPAAPPRASGRDPGPPSAAPINTSASATGAAALTEPQRSPPPGITEEARHLFALAIGEEGPGPMKVIGGYFRDGKNGFPQDRGEAARWYAKGLALGDPDCRCHLARLLLDAPEGVTGDAARAVALLEEAIAAGDTRVLRELGDAYRDGRGGLERDGARAVELYERHAREAPRDGHVTLMPAALMLLGSAPNLPRDAARAAPHLEALVLRDDARAMTLLAGLLRDGDGVPRDLTRARALLVRAVALGHAKAEEELRALPAE